MIVEFDHSLSLLIKRTYPLLGLGAQERKGEKKIEEEGAKNLRGYVGPNSDSELSDPTRLYQSAYHPTHSMGKFSPRCSNPFLS